MTMTSSWLPGWVEVVAVVVYAVILVLHLSHAWSAGRLVRLWHVGHIVMALGMIDMFWPSTMPIGEVGGEAVFAIAAAATLGLGAFAVSSGDNWRIWAVSTVDFVGMVYMFAMMSHRIAPLTIAFVVWSIAEALAWLTGYAFGLLGVSEHGVDLRLSLAAMTVGMAYMFLAMQYGVSDMNGMQHMPGMTETPSPSTPTTSMSGM